MEAPLCSEHELLLSQEDDSYRKEGGVWFNRYFTFMEKYHRVIVGFWLVFLAVSLFFGPEFLDLGNDNQDAPKGTRAYDASEIFEERFPTKAKELPVLIVIACENCDLSKDTQMKAFSDQLHDDLLQYNSTHENVFGWMSYYDYANGPLDNVGQSFMSEDKTVTFITVVESSDTLTVDRYDFIDWLQDEVDELNPNKNKYTIDLSGFDALAISSVKSTSEEVKQVDMFTIPPAMFLLAYMIRSWRMLFICFLNMGTAIMGGFAVMVFLIKGCGVSRPESAAAQLMEVLALSLTIDYVLFICRRVRDETVKNHCSPTKAVYVSMLHAGHVVAMSGLTIVVVFVGFMFLPARVVVMDGVSCSVGVSMSLLVALTNTPALLLTFPNFFTTFDGCCGYCVKPDRDRRGRDLVRSISSLSDRRHSLLLESQQDEVIGEGDDVDDDEGEQTLFGVQSGASVASAPTYPMHHTRVHPMYRGIRFRITRLVTTWPYNLLTIIGLYILVLPLAFQVTRMNVNQDIMCSMPRGSSASDAFTTFANAFPGGTFAPFYIIATKPKNESILDPKLFKMIQDVAEDIMNETECSQDPNSVSSPAYLQGKRISVLEAKAFLFTAKHACQGENPNKMMCSVPLQYQFMWDQSVNEVQDAVLTTIIVPFFPFAQQSKDFIDKVYDIMDRYAPKSKREEQEINLYLSGFEVGFDAIMRNVYHLFPLLICTTLSAVFILIGCMLRSYFVPIRLALTLVLPLAAVFGLGVLVFQDGALEFLGIDAFQSIGGFFWYVPILITSIQLGLALDYDCFLIVRIAEHRRNGYNVQAAVCKACCETGGTISAAGVIMACCFGSLILSNQSTMNLSGFLLLTGVLLDTFVVNTLLVPALMSIGDKVAWLPTKMPMDNLITVDDAEFVGFGAHKPAEHTETSGGSSTGSDEVDLS